MQIILSSIDHILVMEDIEGLIEAGAPVDEYQDEAARIAAAINMLTEENFREDTVLAILTLVWMKSFELGEEAMALRLPALRRVAQAMLDLRS